MKVILNTKELQQGLKVVGCAHSARATLEIVRSVHIRADNNFGMPEMTVTNLETAIRHYQQSGKILEEGATCIDYKTLDKIVKTLKDTKTITIETMPDNKARVADMFTVSTLDAGDYPPLDWVATIPSTLDIKSLATVIHAASKDEMARPVLNSVWVGDAYATTDGFRISTTPKHNEMKPAILLPRTTVEAILKIQNEGVVDMYYNDETKKVIIHLNDKVDVYASLVEGTFPDWRAIFPPKSEHHISFNRDALINTVKKLSSILPKDNTVLRFAPDGMLCNLSVKYEDITADDTLDTHQDGECPEFALDWRYLLQALEQLTEGTVTLKVNAHNTPVLIEEWEYRELIMPMHIGDNDN